MSAADFRWFLHGQRQGFVQDDAGADSAGESLEVPGMLFQCDESRCSRTDELVKIAERVFFGIPEPDREAIEDVCDSILFVDGGSQVAAFSRKDRHIRVHVHDLLKFDDQGRCGVLAHEFGHAIDFSKTKESINSENRSELEQRADGYAREWGYEAHIVARDVQQDLLFGNNRSSEHREHETGDDPTV